MPSTMENYATIIPRKINEHIFRIVFLVCEGRTFQKKRWSFDRSAGTVFELFNGVGVLHRTYLAE